MAETPSTIAPEDSPGRYTLTFGVQVTVELDVDSADTAQLEAGDVVDVLEVAPGAERVRGRLARPPGWITLLRRGGDAGDDADSRLAVRAAAAEDEAEPRGGSTEGSPREDPAAAAAAGAEEDGGREEAPGATAEDPPSALQARPLSGSAGGGEGRQEAEGPLRQAIPRYAQKQAHAGGKLTRFAKLALFGVACFLLARPLDLACAGRSAACRRASQALVVGYTAVLGLVAVNIYFVGRRVGLDATILELVDLVIEMVSLVDAHGRRMWAAGKRYREAFEAYRRKASPKAPRRVPPVPLHKLSEASFHDPSLSVHSANGFRDSELLGPACSQAASEISEQLQPKPDASGPAAQTGRKHESKEDMTLMGCIACCATRAD